MSCPQQLRLRAERPSTARLAGLASSPGVVLPLQVANLPASFDDRLRLPAIVEETGSASATQNAALPGSEAEDEDTVLFDVFRFELHSRQLLECGAPLPVGSRALDILAKLVEKPGELVTKAEIVAHVWPSTLVDESNLRTQMWALRRALRDGEDGRRFVATVPGRGYRFVAQVSRPSGPAKPQHREVVDRFRPRLTSLIGREGELENLRARLGHARLVTIVGHGGIGKTSIATELADELRHQYKEGVFFLNLALVSNEALVGRALAACLGIETGSSPSSLGVVGHAGSRSALLILDGCEHVIDSVAAHADALLRIVPGLQILTTSRERLRVEGECVEHLAPLQTPDCFGTITADEAGRFPAVQLFVERMKALDSGFTLTDANAMLVAEICRKVDGLPLAIEMASASVEHFGLARVASRLDQRLEILVRGQRSANPHHRTMRATLDWSYNALSDQERAVLRRLSVFTGSFTLEAACVLTAGATDTVASDVVADLVSKSLVISDFSPTIPEYRLLNTTRAYALEKLAESRDYPAAIRKHAEYMRGLSVPLAPLPAH